MIDDLLLVVDLDEVEASLRAGEIRSIEQYYDTVRAAVGRDISRTEMNYLRSSIFPAERAILLALPQRESRVTAMELDIEFPIGTRCGNGHLRMQVSDFFVRRGRPVCRRCELDRTARNKKAARDRAAEERAKNPKPRKRPVRHREGARAYRLTERDVLDIRADHKENGERRGWLSRTAEQYGVKHTTIHDVIRRRTWKDV